MDIMDSQNEKLTGTIQYWLEVHRIGSLLFQNFENGDSALRSLITSIIETPLLSDIECLSADQDNGDVACPFTTWILQGLLKATLHNKVQNMKEFYIDAQSKLLSFLYECSVSDFSCLVKLYIQALQQISQVKNFSAHFNFLLLNDFHLEKYDRKLTCASFEINSKKEQINCITIILKVSIIHHKKINNVVYIYMYIKTDLFSGTGKYKALSILQPHRFILHY